jgi:hypothetical protein
MPSARERAWITALAAVTSACVVRRQCNGIGCSAACPREAAREPSGRCACSPDDVPLLGACVPPAIADAYCGPAARYGVGGCVFKSCADGSVLDAVTGACLSKSAVPVPDGLCGDGRTAIVAQGRSVCVPLDAACPRGSARTGTVCLRPPLCPPGTLVHNGVCRPVVTVGARGDLPRVDIGAWAAVVLGLDGGQGTPELCRPLTIRPDIFGLVQGSSSALSLKIAIAAPDQDLTRSFARVGGELRPSEASDRAPHRAPQETSASRPLSAEAEALAQASVATLVEALRGLGGEASTAIVELRVSCAVSP